MTRPAPDDPVRSVIKSRLRLKHLELFRHVSELHTLRKAAEASNMTQPAATKLIRELEDMFGVSLFLRNRRGMQLTAHGEILRRHIGAVMASVGNISAELDQFTKGDGGVIRLGIIPSLSSTFLAHCINELLTRHPHAHFSLQEGTTDELMRELERNGLDIIFGRVLHAGSPSNLRVTKVYTERFDIVCGKKNPLAQQPDVKWKELAAQRWVLPGVGSPLREIAESMFTARGSLRPVVAVASSSFHQMRDVIGSGPLLGVLPHSIAEAGQADGDLVVLKVRQGAKIAPISLIVRKDFEPPPIVTAFEKIALHTARALALD